MWLQKPYSRADADTECLEALWARKRRELPGEPILIVGKDTAWYAFALSRKHRRLGQTLVRPAAGDPAAEVRARRRGFCEGPGYWRRSGSRCLAESPEESDVAPGRPVLMIAWFGGWPKRFRGREFALTGTLRRQATEGGEMSSLTGFAALNGTIASRADGRAYASDSSWCLRVAG